MRLTHTPSVERLRVMRAIECCRTAALGGHVEVCSQLVYECLPRALRGRVPAWPKGRPVAPNDFARAFGAAPGGSDVVL